MNPQQSYEFIQVMAAITRAQTRVAAMTAENEQRKITGCSMAYDDKAFLSVIDEEGIGVNQITMAGRRILESA